MLNRSIKYLFAALIVAASLPAMALNINLIEVGDFSGTNQGAWDGFVQAATRWESLLSDQVTVNVEVGFSDLGSSILAQAGSYQGYVGYTSVRNALDTDRKSADDLAAVGSLTTDNTLAFVTNTSSGELVVDNGTGFHNGFNNENVKMTSANAKALGLLDANNTVVDAEITFNSSFDFDYDPGDLIEAGFYDFVGVASHELGHALGFISGVDQVDRLISATPDGVPADWTTGTGVDALVSTLDLFRYSGLVADAESDLTGVDVDLDFSVHNGYNPYFSLDGGATSLGLFSTGVDFGDGRQASHWKDNLGLGLLDPTAAQGELLQIGALDRLAMDVIGWDLIDPVAVPLPAAFWFFGSGLLVLLGVRRYSEKQ